MTNQIQVDSKQEIKKISEELYRKNREIALNLEASRKMSELLREEKEKIEVILENIIDVVIFLDQDDRIIMVNKAFENQFGLKKEEAIGKNLNQIIKIYLGKNLLDIHLFNTLIKKNEKGMYSNQMVQIVGKREIFGTLGISYVAVENNKRRTILTIHDKTHEHDLENMKLDFVSMAAHELRTPITSIRGYASLMEEELDQSHQLPVEEWKLLLSRISLSAGQLLALVENILNVTKIEKGVLSLSSKNENWTRCVSEVVEQFLEGALSKNIKLTFEEHATDLWAFVDKLRIQEVLSNLLSNAITYTQEGGLVKISAKISEDQDWIETTVQDTGPGIAKHSQTHLFEKFFRVSGPLEQGSKGNGLGLYIAKSVVQMHGGKIWVDSDTGKGAAFTFTVPRITT